MKKIIIVALAILLGTAPYAQTTDTASGKPQIPVSQKAKSDIDKKGAVINEDMQYCCPECDFCDSKPGKCPVHNLELIKSGSYYCGSCYTLSANAAKCPKCGKDMNKMDCKTVKNNLKTPINK